MKFYPLNQPVEDHIENCSPCRNRTPARTERHVRAGVSSESESEIFPYESKDFEIGIYFPILFLRNRRPAEDLKYLSRSIASFSPSNTSK
jgi:hypothetical protein